jgi:hypothetical protein
MSHTLASVRISAQVQVEQSVGAGAQSDRRHEWWQQFAQTRLPIRGRLFDVDQHREMADEAVLVFKPGKVLAGRNPAVRLPVETDENVALGE